MTIAIVYIIVALSSFGMVCTQEPTTAAPTSDGLASEERNSYAALVKIRVDEELRPRNITQGGRLSLDCSITGYPTPIYNWYKDGVLILPNNRRYMIRLTDWGNRLRASDLKMSDAGVYSCEAQNVAGTRNTSALVTVLLARRTTTTQSARGGQSAPTTRSDDTIIDPFCQDYRGRYCNFLLDKEIYVTSRTDQNDGELGVVDLVKQLTDMNVDVKSECFQKSVEAACYDKLPVCAERPGSLPPVPRKLCEQECTALFHLCKNDFPEDASVWSVLPSCTDLDNNAGCVHIGLTAVPEQTQASVTEENSSGDTGALSNILVNVAVPVIIAILLVIAIIVLAVCISKRRKKLRGGSSVPSSNGSHGKSVELSSMSDRAAAIYIKDVSLDNINMLQELGESNYGKVYHGQVFGLYGNNTASAVFIKCLQEKATPEQHAEYREEISSMSEIRHQHVVSLLALSSTGPTPCLLYEHLQLGDLRQFLLSQQSRGNSLTNKELMYIVTQVASAMEYLAGSHYVHKDIAAHNVIVSHNLNVKLSNLKVIYGVHSANYCMLHNRMLPIRWLPAESITYSKYSEETDVYSYGVLLWESFSGAQLPYAGFTNQEVIEMVRSRQLLACPTSCPPRIYSLMMECWHETPSKRPTSKEVHQKLRAWYLDNSYAISTTTGPSISASGSTCTAPSHHSSSGPPASNINANSNHTNLTDVQGSRLAVDELAIRPGYLQSSKEDTAPYYSTIDSSYNERGPHTPSSSSFDNASEYTESTVPPLQPSVNNMLPPNYYACSSTPTHRYASLGRQRNNDTEFGTQTTPLFQQMDQV